jgi:hypothetical protein
MQHVSELVVPYNVYLSRSVENTSTVHTVDAPSYCVICVHFLFYLGEFLFFFSLFNVYAPSRNVCMNEKKASKVRVLCCHAVVVMRVYVRLACVRALHCTKVKVMAVSAWPDLYCLSIERNWDGTSRGERDLRVVSSVRRWF